jgi:SAM-dependent methyltransferase
VSDSPSPFAAAALFYDRFRAPYAPAALTYIAAEFALGPDTRVLDLGCGPGTLAIPLSSTGAQLVAVDPDPAMLAQGRALAAERGAAGIRWIQARAEDLPADLGPFHLAVMGQSLHWMDRDRVLARLADLIAPGGGLAIVDEGARRPQESWEGVAAQVATRYLGRRGRHPGKHPEAAHEPSLRRSAHFADFTVREFPSAITRDIPQILGCFYSSAGVARPLFGDAVGAFEAELTAELLKLNPLGRFHERLETAVFVARLAA